ncbi:MAG TPA: hypothetical protein VIJ28_22080 [Chloroflexota bacterium]
MKCVLLSMYGSRGDVEPLVELAVRLRALGARFDPVATATEGCDALAAGGMMPAGV